MKNLITIALAISTFSVSIYLDSKLYYYGLSWLDIYNHLPNDLTPVFRYDFEGGFAIEDKDGFYVISEGEHQFVGSTQKINIQQIINYGFRENELVANVINNKNEKYQIILKRNDHDSEQFRTSIQKGFNENMDSYTWVQIADYQDQFSLKKQVRDCFLVLSVIISLLMVYQRIGKSKFL